MAERLKFTKRAVEALTTEAGKDRTYYYDTVVPSLCVSVAAGGTKSFFVYRKVRGRPTRHRIGSFPEMSVELARQRAAAVNLQILDGQDPHADRQAKRAEPTLGEAFDLWMTHAKAHKRTWDQDEYQYDRFLKPWASRSLSSIRHADVVHLHAEIGEHSGKYSANRALALLRSTLNHAIRLLELDQANPAASVRASRAEQRERRLRPEELPPFSRALPAEPNTDFRAYIFLSLFTGARKSNLLAMRWDEVSFAQRLWVVPADKSKNGRAMPVPLSVEALRILQDRRERADQGEGFIFPGSGKSGHLQDPKFCWKRVCERAGIANLRLHDLRRTLASFQIDGGASLEVVGKTLGHQSAQTTKIYARMALDPVRESVERAAKSILEAANGGGTNLGEEKRE